MKNISLNGTWALSGNNPDTKEALSLTAKVPGSVLCDIVGADIENIDIFYRDNSEKFEKYEMWDWHYEKTFVLDEVAFHTELYFSKLDTYCDVYLNDTWYALDATWDDPIIMNGGKLTDEYKYAYFLRGSNEFFKNHFEDGNIVDNSNFKYPEISREDY
jgi:hypothetical protein